MSVTAPFGHKREINGAGVSGQLRATAHPMFLSFPTGIWMCADKTFPPQEQQRSALQYPGSAGSSNLLPLQLCPEISEILDWAPHIRLQPQGARFPVRARLTRTFGTASGSTAASGSRELTVLRDRGRFWRRLRGFNNTHRTANSASRDQHQVPARF